MIKNNIFKMLTVLLLVLSMTVTGAVLYIFATDDEAQIPLVKAAGDMNGDAKINLLDLLLMRRYFADFDFDSGNSAEIADVDFNGDGAFDTNDVIAMQQYLLDMAYDSKVDNIMAVSPAVGSEVVLANDTVYAWYQQFDATSKTLPPVAKADIYYPVPVTLEWLCSKEASYYLVYVSDNQYFDGCKSFVTNKPSISVENLFVGTNYYWQVDAVTKDATYRSEVFSFKTAVTPRTITIDGVSNTRDIGGLPTASGNSLKQGMIYRGGKLENITEKGKQQFLYEFGIKTDLDLRTVGEGGAGVKSPVSDSLKYFIYDGRYYTGSYGKGIDTEEGKSIMADEIRVFANPDNYPVYIHCSLGRDRTGTLVMILQALCGVEKWDIYADYEMSMFSYGGTQDGSNPWAAITATCAYINSNYSGDSFAEKTENYLLSCGITAEEIATIRSILIEEVK